jgi:hypothetical protein
MKYSTKSENIKNNNLRVTTFFNKIVYIKMIYSHVTCTHGYDCKIISSILLTRNTCMQQPLAYIIQTLFQHEVFVITPTLNAGSRCPRHVCHGNKITF